MHLIRTILQRLQREHGFALPVVAAVMLAGTLATVAALQITQQDLLPGAEDKEKKAALAAAEAGVMDYLARLTAEPDYWRRCASDTSNAAINQHGVTSGARRWATISGSSAQYSVEVLPANGAAACDANNAQATFIDSGTGTFRIRSTGRTRDEADSERRSVVTTFRRRGFLDFIYFTDYETQDPTWYRRSTGGLPTRADPEPERGNGRDVITWGNQDCVRYFREGRGAERWQGTGSRSNGRFVSGAWQNYGPLSCGEISFIGLSDTRRDFIRGPFHTNDEILICGTPHFGRRPSDDIEVSAPGSTTGTGNPEGWRQGCSGGEGPRVNQPDDPNPAADRGTWRKNAPILELPPSNTRLRDEALPSYRFMGETRIVMNGTTMTVTGKRDNGRVLTNVSMPIPTDGVIYVANDPGGSCAGYDPLNPYAAQPSCGTVRVRGTYARSITIAAQNDVIVEEDVTKVGDVLLGLIASNWIRVYHPTRVQDGNCVNDGGPSGGLTIEAALLALNHSFTVDTFWCGDPLGNLTVTGAIAQRFRGPVGQFGSPDTGYIKNYTYDDRLRFRSPPRFLDPVQSTWRVQQQAETVPPRVPTP
jgi:hypothetical protein